MKKRRGTFLNLPHALWCYPAQGWSGTDRQMTRPLPCQSYASETGPYPRQLLRDHDLTTVVGQGDLPCICLCSNYYLGTYYRQEEELCLCLSLYYPLPPCVGRKEDIIIIGIGLICPKCGTLCPCQGQAGTLPVPRKRRPQTTCLGRKSPALRLVITFPWNGKRKNRQTGQADRPWDYL